MDTEIESMNKEDLFEVIKDDSDPVKFFCKICKVSRSTEHRILTQLRDTHKRSKLK